MLSYLTFYRIFDVFDSPILLLWDVKKVGEVEKEMYDGFDQFSRRLIEICYSNN